MIAVLLIKNIWEAFFIFEDGVSKTQFKIKYFGQ